MATRVPPLGGKGAVLEWIAPSATPICFVLNHSAPQLTFDQLTEGGVAVLAAAIVAGSAAWSLRSFMPG
jgi:hypothetical protein